MVDDGRKDHVYRIFNAGDRGVDFHIRAGWRFEGGGDSRKILDLTGTSALVESFYIACFTNLQGRVQEDLNEVFLPNDAAGQGTDLVGGANKGADGDHAGFDQQLGDFGDAPDVLEPVVFAESQVVVDAGSYVIPIQDLAKEPVKKEFLLQVGSQGGFSRPGKSGEPDHFGALPQDLLFHLPVINPVKYGVDIFCQNIFID